MRKREGGEEAGSVKVEGCGWRKKEKNVKVEPLESAISSLSEPQSSVVVKRTPLGSLVWNLNGCKR
jgi:hypothetical protein